MNNWKPLLTDDDEGHAVEPSTEVGETPQKNTKLKRIYEILDEEESAQFGYGGVGVSHCDVGNIVNFFSRQSEVDVENISEEL